MKKAKKSRKQVVKKQVPRNRTGNPKENKGFESKKPKGPTTPEKRRIKASLPEEQRLRRKLKRIRLPNDVGMRAAFRDPSNIRPTVRGIIINRIH